MASNTAPPSAPGELPDLSQHEIDRCIARRIQDRRFSAAACIASRGGGIFHRAVYGSRTLPPPQRRIGHDALFDLASLTKPLGAGLAMFRLVSQGRADLGAPIGRLVPELRNERFGAITVDMLLDHTSGFPPVLGCWGPMQEEDGKRSPTERIVGTRRAVPEIKRRVAELELIHPPGTVAVYSDVGFMVLGWAVENITGKPLDDYLRREIFVPLGLADDLFFVRNDDSRQARWLARRTFVATENCPLRGRLIEGQVHDPIAWAMGGVAGHAGLFGTADAVWRLSRTLLASYDGEDSFFHTGTLRRFWVRSKRVRATTRTLGWDTPNANDSSAGKRFARTSVGHLGFTGTSLWIDPSSGVIGLLLCNAVHPDEKGARETLRELRPRIYDLIASLGDTIVA